MVQSALRTGAGDTDGYACLPGTTRKERTKSQSKWQGEEGWEQKKPTIINRHVEMSGHSANSYGWARKWLQRHIPNSARKWTLATRILGTNVVQVSENEKNEAK